MRTFKHLFVKRNIVYLRIGGSLSQPKNNWDHKNRKSANLTQNYMPHLRKVRN